ncbi:hypothetical protein ACFQ3P_00285 [Paraburkholderia sabiae]|jgi:hypothetical protein|uniref:Uncharacterized protein n=1 Tax=Paraburkholderia sabiae TaxID=273251 RepID=A0ABU9Q8G9_9BURK|nr:hypothetical protein [Paraburkholderia sabiae]WJZ78325.1 hypothetical protein QEN71_30495 [Paraburkholderia sabiae]CAD6507280.1 hypothetical protein LMG24235_00056 [Paraburkholderia sabiae]
MGSAQPLAHRDVVPDVPAAQVLSNVIPLRARRVQLEVFLADTSPATRRTHLATLFHSPLGVYISHAQLLRNKTCVQFNIAPEDLDFTLHTLIGTISEATIGKISRIAN